MADLHDQLRAYGRQIQSDLADPPDAADSPDTDRPVPPARNPARRQWLLVAAATAAVAVTASLPTVIQSEEESMRRGSGAVLGFCLLAAACGSDTQDSASTTAPPPATNSTSAGPPQESASLLDGTGEVAPGTYVVDRFGTPIQVTMPAGWERIAGVAVKGPDEAVVAFSDVGKVYTDACNYIDKAEPIGSTTEALVQALQDQEGSQTSQPEPVDIDGFAGYQLVISNPAGLDVKKCWGGQRSIWEDVDGPVTDSVGPATPINVLILDLEGRRAVISSMSYQPMSAQTQAELAAIVDSIRIG